MSPGLKLLIICLLGIVLLALVAIIIKCLCNIRVLIREKKHPGSIPRSGAGVVFNKKTGKLDSTPGKPILPF